MFKKIKIIVHNLTLLFKCFVYFLLNGKANKSINSPKSVVIIQRGQFGDMIVTTSMFRAVKKVYPNCMVTVIGSALNKKVLEGNTDIDEYIIWDNNESKTINTLSKKHYDFGCITSPNFHSLATLYLSGIKTIAAPIIKNGWSPYETTSYKIIRNFVIEKDHVMRRYVPREFLKLLEPIGIFTDDTKKYIYWSKVAEEKINDFILKLDGSHEWLVGIMPGAGNKVKQWPADRFSKVADYLIEKHNAKILIIGSESNRKEIDEMINGCSYKEKVIDASWTSVDELKALVSKLDFTVSVDTGPVFIAEAAGVPTIDIAGSIDPKEMAPNDGDKHLVVVSEGEPEIWTMNARILNYERAKKQIESITIPKVTEVIDQLITKIKKVS